MVNPFSEVADGDADDLELVEQARNGDRAALEKLVLRHQAWIYNIAVRMVFQPQDAEEVTQDPVVPPARPWNGPAGVDTRLAPGAGCD